MINTYKNILKIASGPLAFLILELVGKPESLSSEAYQVLCATVWIAAWWVLEAVPLAITSLLPIVLFPLTGALDIGTATASYGHKYIFLYMGGFMIAIAIEKWNLHKRIALNIIALIGSNASRIILGFMIATAFLSMWISNTATSVMMLPIGMAIVVQFNLGAKDRLGEKFGKALMLAIAYSASIGGFATLIGTPPNLVLAGVLEELYGYKLTFVQWTSFFLPLSVLMLFICWKYLTNVAFNFKNMEFPGGKEEIQRNLKKLGKISYEEKAVLIVFVLTATAWMTRAFIEKLLPAIDDTIIAIVFSTILFVIPSSKERGRKLINWEEAVKLPWGVILLFGGGLAIAKGFGTTGLAEWIAFQLSQMNGVSLLLLVLILVTVVNLMTEVTSNLATTAMLLPVIAPMALTFDIHPLMVMVSVTVAASCAFMLPVATPPNAVVFGSGYLRIPDMVKSGVIMNIVSIILITLVIYFIFPHVWDIDPNSFPETFVH